MKEETARRASRPRRYRLLYLNDRRERPPRDPERIRQQAPGTAKGPAHKKSDTLLPDQPARRDRPGHRLAAAPLRTRPSRLADPRRRHQVRQHPRRRRTPVRRTPARRKEQAGHPGLPKGKDYKPRTGKAFLHTVIDDHSRVAFAEICTDEKARTAAGALERAVAWFPARGVTVERVLSDNGSCYRSLAWRDTSDAQGHHFQDGARPAAVHDLPCQHIAEFRMPLDANL